VSDFLSHRQAQMKHRWKMGFHIAMSGLTIIRPQFLSPVRFNKLKLCRGQIVAEYICIGRKLFRGKKFVFHLCPSEAENSSSPLRVLRATIWPSRQSGLLHWAGWIRTCSAQEKFYGELSHHWR
jgi:hypothetical protein